MTQQSKNLMYTLYVCTFHEELHTHPITIAILNQT